MSEISNNLSHEMNKILFITEDELQY